MRRSTYRFRVVGQGGAWEFVQGLGWRKKKGESLEKNMQLLIRLRPGLFYLFLGYAVGTCNFDAQLSGIKFWKGDENLRPVKKKTKKICFTKY